MRTAAATPTAGRERHRPGAGAVPSNVPTTLSSFIGRAATVAELAQALASQRLVTVVGPGGAGKTRLAREVAVALSASSEAAALHPDGVWWVELAPVRLGADVAGAVASALSVNPTPGRRLVDALADALRGQRLLLVLDNCEHLLMETAELVDSVLRTAPGVTILCTSREALSTDGEVAWPIGALPRPSSRDRLGADEVAGFEAVQLFVERARSVTPGFALTDANAGAVATICERLDGLPLALELAAAVVPVLGVEALAARVDDALTLLSRGRRTALPRHRTLHAVLDWSYALLEPDERMLLRNLSVFRGSFTLDAMADVCGARGAELDLLPALGRLVEHSLIEVREEEGEARYRLLETIRQFGSMQLSGTPEEEVVRGRHAEWVAGLAAEAEPALFSPARGRTVERLRLSMDEIRAALTWATGPSGSPLLGARIAGLLGWFWISGVPWEEARALLALVLEAIDAQGIPDDRRSPDELIAIGRLMYPIEGLAYFGGDTDTMLRVGQRDMAIWDRVDAAASLSEPARLTSARGRSLGLQLIGFAHAMRGDRDAAVASMSASIDVAARSGDPWILAVLTMRRALVHFMIGEHAKAQADYDAAVPSLRAQGELWFLSLALEGMAMNALALGDPAAGARFARESVTVLRPEPDPWFISRSLDTMAFILVSRLGDPLVSAVQSSQTAARLLGAAGSLRNRCGAGVIRPDAQRESVMIRSLSEQLGADEYARCLAFGATLSLQDVFALMDDDPVVSAYTSTAPLLPRQAERLALQVLGPFTMVRAGDAVPAEAVPMGKTRELLLFLLLHDRATKDEIGLALWPDSTAAQVRNAFHVTLHHLRRHLGPEHWIAFEGGTYRLDRTPRPDVVLEADVDALLATSARLRQALRRREAADDASLDGWRSVLEQGSGELAQGFAGGEWLVGWQDRTRNAWVEAMESLAGLLRNAGRTDDVLAVCELLVAREPLRESAHRLLMEAMVARGEPARALAHYDMLTGLLQREVGSRPAPETRALAEGLRRLP